MNGQSIIAPGVNYLYYEIDGYNTGLEHFVELTKVNCRTRRIKVETVSNCNGVLKLKLHINNSIEKGEWNADIKKNNENKELIFSTKIVVY